MDRTAFLSIRVPEQVRNRVKAIAAARGEKLQDLVAGLITRFLDEADRRPPELAEVVRRIRTIEERLRSSGVAALWVFGSVARGDARPDSDVDLSVAFDPGTEPSLFDVSRIKEMLEQVLGRTVDLGERSTMKPRVAASADRDSVQVF